MVSHGNLLENSAHIAQAFEISPDDVSVTWLPVFHDMGLTNGIIQPMYGGRQCILMPPQSFLQRPVRWLQAVSNYKATISGGPNFAYEMCARKITPEQRSGLDLSSWKLAYNGAEPVRAETLKRFAAAFAPCGFRPNFFYPCYGLAEATLIVSGGFVKDEPSCTRSKWRRLSTITTASSRSPIVGRTPALWSAAAMRCGHEDRHRRSAVIDGLRVGRGRRNLGVGPERDPGILEPARGNRITFHAYLADTGEGPFLRTGDLGFLGMASCSSPAA